MADTSVKVRLLRAAGRGVVWLVPRAARAAGGLLLLAGWATWVWLSGGRWTRTPRRRYVTRPVRAAGNWLVTVTVAGLAAAPAVTALVLAVAGVGLLLTAAAVRPRQPAPAGGPIRVRAHVGTPAALRR